MVNLLFISNSSKIESIKNTLQPFLKVKLDIVGDFDYGLKDVFEKRPATVFIQDQIAGVTGESVARHIQMLLGSGAPLFIFMHDGSLKAKPIKGLFEYLIDLSLAEVKIVEEIQATLKSLLGPTQWDKIYIQPRIDYAANRDAVAVPVGSRAVADQLVDDFLSDLDGFGSASAEKTRSKADFTAPETTENETFQVVSSPQEQLADMLSEASKIKDNSDSIHAAAHNISTLKSSLPELLAVTPQQVKYLVLPELADSAAPVTASFSPLLQPVSKKLVQATPIISKTPDDASATLTQQSVPELQSLQQASPADFVIDRDGPVENISPEDLLRVFEGDYFSHSGKWKRSVTIAVVLTICAGGGIFYLLKQKPSFLTPASKPSTHPVVMTPAVQLLEKVIAVQKPVSAQIKKADVPALPSFIPQAGLDSSFASLKPGWERYTDTTLDFRLYRSAGRIKALQVLGRNNHDISEPKLKSVLIELLGDGEYRVKSRERKLGYHISRAIVGQKADLLIYHKKTAIRAFVVSLD